MDPPHRAEPEPIVALVDEAVVGYGCSGIVENIGKDDLELTYLRT